MLSDEQKADGWIEHGGGPMPVAADNKPLVIARGGNVGGFGSWRADELNWEHMNDPFDIIAYRPVQP